jgi:hypothetical protein
VEQWEYTTAIWTANIENEGVREFVRARWPDWKVPEYAPQTLMPLLNSWGELGWELVTIQPVHAGSNLDIGTPSGAGGGTDWTNSYFVAFKRRKTGQL